MPNEARSKSILSGLAPLMAAACAFVTGCSIIAADPTPLRSIPVTERDEFTAKINSFTPDGVISLNVTFDFAEPTTVYSWRESLNPLLGYALNVHFQNTPELTLNAEPIPGIVPKFPHRSDVSVGKIHSYAPLTFRIVDEKGRPFHGCVDLVITYDTTKSPSYARAGLDAIQIRTRSLRACNLPEN